MKKALLVLVLALLAVNNTEAASVWSSWTNGPPTDPNYFPIIANYQHTQYIDEYQAMGMNTFSGLDWPGVSASVLQQLKDGGMYLIGDINDDATYALRNDKTIIGWTMCDEPDNWQYTTPITIRGKAFPDGGGNFPGRVPPADFKDMYDYIKTLDNTRPILCCLSQGVANDAWVGRGSAPAGGWPAEYTEYVKGTDIAGFDVYPVVSNGMGDDYLWYQAKGLDRLNLWSGGKPILNAIETTHINNASKLPTPHQVRSEVWISLVHGANGVMYFLHEFAPAAVTGGIFLHQEIVDEVTKINTQIKQLAPVLNSTTLTNKATVSTSSATVSINIMVKEYGNAVYVFAAGMTNAAATGTFHINGLSGDQVITVLGESRSINAVSGTFADSFAAWDVHLYSVSTSAGGSSADSNPLGDIRVFPNPCKVNSGTKKARFNTIMSQDVIIKLFNIEGNLVKTVREADFGNMGTAEWDLKNDDGSYVSSGIYFFVAEDSGGHRKTGKIAVGK